MRIIRWICGSTMRDKMRSEYILAKVSVTPIEERWEKTAYNSLIIYNAPIWMH